MTSKPALRAYWWRPKSGPPNWGDAIAPVLVSELSGCEVIWSDTPPRFLTVGSIVSKARAGDTVWGSGLNCGDPAYVRTLSVAGVEYRAVRGPLTRQRLVEQGAVVPEIYGDPGLLMNRLYQPRGEVVHDVGLVPHFVDRPFGRRVSGVHFIDIMGGIKDVMDEVASCDLIISSSLHGVILAESLGKRCAYVEMSDRVIGGTFKFHDYYLATGRQPIEPLNWRRSEDIRLSEASKMAYGIARPKIDLDRLLSACPFALRRSSGQGMGKRGLRSESLSDEP